jgi:hypothetical protein
MTRPAIPAELRRQVLVESGHACAVCKSRPVDLSHIEPWATVQEHTYENLIALCPNCHRDHHDGRIDRASLRVYKSNLIFLNSRYSEYERRVLEWFADVCARPPRPDVQGAQTVAALRISESEFHVLHLVKDGLIKRVAVGGAHMRVGGVDMTPKAYLLTQAGAEFIERWIAGRELENEKAE